MAVQRKVVVGSLPRRERFFTVVDIEDSMPSIKDWSDFKKLVEKFLDTGAIDNKTVTSCRLMLEKADETESKQARVYVAITVLLRGFGRYFPKRHGDWRKRTEEEENEIQSRLSRLKSLPKTRNAKKSQKKTVKSYKCGICKCKMMEKSVPQICSACLKDSGGSGADPDLDPHDHQLW